MKFYPIFSISAALLISAVSLPAQDSPEKPKEPRLVSQPDATAPESQNASANPAQLKIDNSLKATLDSFFLALRKNQIDEAYQQLTKGSKIAEKAEDIVTLKKQTKKAIDLFGAIQGYELVQILPVGTRLQRVTCLSFGKDLPLRWRFYFYRADNDWKLIDLGVDDRLIDLFNENGPFLQGASKAGEPQQ